MTPQQAGLFYDSVNQQGLESSIEKYLFKQLTCLWMDMLALASYLLWPRKYRKIYKKLGEG